MNLGYRTRSQRDWSDLLRQGRPERGLELTARGSLWSHGGADAHADLRSPPGGSVPLRAALLHNRLRLFWFCSRRRQPGHQGHHDARQRSWSVGQDQCRGRCSFASGEMKQAVRPSANTYRQKRTQPPQNTTVRCAHQRLFIGPCTELSISLLASARFLHTKIYTN